MELAPGTMVNANVRLVELLGVGGMGSVWLADHLSLETRVAVKFIAPQIVGSDPTIGERFKREAQISAKLRSIHVVQVFDHGKMNDGTPYIVMELLQGNTLTDVIESQGPRSLREVGMIVAQVGKVLHRAHSLSIVHRDIKPDNIFITQSDDYDLIVKVLDFGIAKRTAKNGEAVTKTGVVVGSPEFMSPEQAINSKDVDHRTDLYSLGVVAYYAITSALPFDEDRNTAWWLQLANDPHVVPSKRNPLLAGDVDDFFERALQPKPEARFQSAREFTDTFAVLADPRNSSTLADLSSSMDGAAAPVSDAASVVDPDTLEQATVRMRIRGPNDAAMVEGLDGGVPSARAVDADFVQGALVSAPTMMAGPPGASPQQQAPPWAATRYKQRPGWRWLLVAVSVIVVAVVAALLVAGVGSGR